MAAGSVDTFQGKDDRERGSTRGTVGIRLNSKNIANRNGNGIA
jgi:hypothetical protein